MHAVYETAYATGLFGPTAIKVRITPYKEYYPKDNFIHIFGNIMEGRTIKQKKELSTNTIKILKEMFPSIKVISMNIIDFEKATYRNLSMI